MHANKKGILFIATCIVLILAPQSILLVYNTAITESLSFFVTKMLWSFALLSIAIGIAGVILYAMHQLTSTTPTIECLPKDGLDELYILTFLNRDCLTDERIRTTLHRIQKIVPYLNEHFDVFDIEMQHQLERTINRQLKTLLTHYDALLPSKQHMTQDELYQAILTIEETIEQQYIPTITRYHTQGFLRTKSLL